MKAFEEGSGKGAMRTATASLQSTALPCCLKALASSACRSNSTHIAWSTTKTTVHSSVTNGYSDQDGVNVVPNRRQRQRLLTTNIGTSPMQGNQTSCICDDKDCTWQSWDAASHDSYRYLRQHIMTLDLPQLSTLGFDDDGALNAVDGLDGGMVGPTIEYALRAKQTFAYADLIPRDIWQEYVLNYANVNEARSNWRPYLWSKLLPILVDNATDPPANIEDAVYRLNRDMWTVLAPLGTDSIRFVSSQTPLIFDPMSVLVFGYASCTGLAILFVDAARTMGIPARLAGTPAWHQNVSQGNHNWVEVWSVQHQAWKFMEPSPAQTVVDHMDRDPCQRWFCSSTRFIRDAPHNTTQAYAARLESTNTFFRLAWEWHLLDVPADDQTANYIEACSRCP